MSSYKSRNSYRTPRKPKFVLLPTGERFYIKIGHTIGHLNVFVFIRKQSNNKMAAGITFTNQICPNHAMYEDDMDDGMVGNGLTLAGSGIFNIGNSKLRAIKRKAPKIANILFNTSTGLASTFGNENTQRRAQNAQLARSVIQGAGRCVPAQGLRHKMGN